MNLPKARYRRADGRTVAAGIVRTAGNLALIRYRHACTLYTPRTHVRAFVHTASLTPIR